jgi:hypothetical protein
MATTEVGIAQGTHINVGGCTTQNDPTFQETDNLAGKRKCLSDVLLDQEQRRAFSGNPAQTRVEISDNDGSETQTDLVEQARRRRSDPIRLSFSPPHRPTDCPAP